MLLLLACPVAAARTAGLHAVCNDLRKLLPSELPLPEGWPPEGAGGEDALGLGPRQGAGKEGEEDEDDEDESRVASRSATPFPASEHGSMAVGRGLYPVGAGACASLLYCSIASYVDGAHPCLFVGWDDGRRERQRCCEVQPAVLAQATLPPTWLRFLRAPLGDPLAASRLMATLASMAAKKWAADREARLRGLPPPDLHAFVYRQVLDE